MEITQIQTLKKKGQKDEATEGANCDPSSTSLIEETTLCHLESLPCPSAL